MPLMTPEIARRNSDRSLFGAQTPFFNTGRVETLKTLLGELNPDGTTNSPIERLAYEWNERVMATPTSFVAAGPVNPWNIPGTYDDPTGSDAVLELIEADFQACAYLAIRWAVLGDTAAADAAVRILDAWAVNLTWVISGTNATGTLVWSSRWPVLLQAAMILRGYVGYTESLDDRLKAATEHGRIMSQARYGNNNTGSWGVVWEMAAAVFLGDRDMFDTAIMRWRTNFESGVVNNVPVEEIYRQGGILHGDGRTGLWYCNFFVYALTVAAEWARFGGEWLYDFKCRDGSTFKDTVLRVRSWTAHPSTYPYNSSPNATTNSRILPHDEITHALWPNADSQLLIDTFKQGNTRDNIGVAGAVLAYRGRPLYG